MRKGKNISVIFDTNVWISFLIGKKLHIISDYISNGQITIIITEQLLTEIKEVTHRPKLKKYFPENKVKELISLLTAIGTSFVIEPNHQLCRDKKDNFLLDLADASNADYLITGDKDLLALNPFKATNIITPYQFENELKGK